MQKAANVVLVQSEELPDGIEIVRGYEFSGESVDYNALLASYKRTGFQASNFNTAVDIINDMVRSHRFF